MSINLPEEIRAKTTRTELNGKTASRRPLSHLENRSFHFFFMPAIIITALLAVGYVFFYFNSRHDDSENIVQANGRIETAETFIRAPTATRVTFVAVREGDAVHKGQLIVRLDSATLQKRINDSSPDLKATLEARRQTDAQVAAVQNQIGTAQAKSHGFLAKLFSTKSGREKKAAELRSEMMQAKMMSMKARSAVASVKGARAEAYSKLSDFNITSPIDGICTIRSAQPGELVGTGQVMLTLVSNNSAYLRSFVPESDISRIRVGQKALVLLDSALSKPMPGRVSAIDSEPSFTPENVYLKKDRERQAFGVKINIDHPDGLAKPGMPAEGQIIVKTKAEKN